MPESVRQFLLLKPDLLPVASGFPGGGERFVVFVTEGEITETQCLDRVQ